MNQASLLAGALVLAAFAPAATGQTYTETFTGGVNAGGWTLGNPADTIEASGGNPGQYLHNANLDTFAPQPRTGTGVTSAFTGNYRTRGVASVGVDLRTFSTQFNFARPLALILENDSGCAVYFLSSQMVPQVAEGWKSFDFSIPWQSLTLPAGWSELSGCGGSPDATWNAVITDVDRVRFFYGDPTNFFIFDLWNVGIDNARVAETFGVPFCFGDGTGSACPCGNTGPAGSGCMNSSGTGGKLSASGTQSIAANDQVFLGTLLRPNALSILLQGDAQIPATPFGDGLRCAGGALKRLGTQTASAAGTASFGPGLAGTAGWLPGTPYFFHVYYRDPFGACANGFNSSHGLVINLGP